LPMLSGRTGPGFPPHLNPHFLSLRACPPLYFLPRPTGRLACCIFFVSVPSPSFKVPVSFSHTPPRILRGSFFLRKTGVLVAPCAGLEPFRARQSPPFRVESFSELPCNGFSPQGSVVCVVPFFREPRLLVVRDVLADDPL